MLKRPFLPKTREKTEQLLSAIANSTKIETKKQQRTTEQQRTFRVATIVLLQ